MPGINLNVVGLFAGVGGIELGFQNAGFTPVVANEIDSYAASTYRAMHGTPLLVASISDISKPKLEDEMHKQTGAGIKLSGGILTGGFPCQPFSVAGFRKGFDDDRGNVFWDIIRLANEIQPDVIFLENVKNLESHDERRTFGTILSVLRGQQVSNANSVKLFKEYFVKSKVLNAKDFGIPQNRERIFIVAFKDENAFERFEFPAAETRKHGLASLSKFIDFDSKVDDKYYYKPGSAIYDRLVSEVVEPGTIYQWRRQYVRANKSGVSPTLTANMGMGGHNVPIVLSKFGIRKLTPTECFQLMGFKNPNFEPGIADSRLYKQAGNAVVVDVIQAVAKNIHKALSGNNVGGLS
jgi:DNA (cytosine-5)-methyltransferase 1